MPRRLTWSQRYWLRILAGVVLGLVIGYCAGEERDEVRRACDAEGGRVVWTAWGTLRCEVRGDSAVR